MMNIIEYDVKTISASLLKTLATARQKFAKMSKEEWEKKPADKWSKKEMLRHLIDSAANNYQRFVRAQFANEEYVGPGYEQDLFVSTQHYHSEEIENLMVLWFSFNVHLMHVIKNADSSKLNTTCKIGNYDPQTLGFVMHDYVEHMNHHLDEIYK